MPATDRPDAQGAGASNTALSMIGKWGMLALKLAMTVGPLLYLFFTVDLERAWQAAITISPWALAGSVALLIVQVMLCAYRWRLILIGLGARMGFFSALGIYWTGNFFGLVLPGAVGGDAVRMWQTKRAGLPLTVSINSVLLERVATVLGLALLVTFTEPAIADHIPSGLWLFPAISAAGIAGILAVAMLERLPERLRQFRPIRALGYLASDTRRIFLSPRTCLTVMAVVLVGHVNLSLGVHVLAAGLGAPVTVLQSLALVPPIILITTLPISIAGWGARELAMVTILGFVGVHPAEAMAVSILFGLVTTLTALPGGLIWYFSGARREKAGAMTNA